MQRPTLLDNLGSMLDPNHPGPGERVRHDLQRAIDDAASAPPAGRAVRRRAATDHRRRLVTAASLAVVLTAGTLAMQTVRIAGRPPASVANAADLLNRAALAADREPGLTARPEQFVFIEWIGDAPTDPPETRRLQRWLSADGTRGGLFRWRLEAQPSRWHDETQAASGQPAYRADLPTDPKAMLRYLYAQRPKLCDSNGSCAQYDPTEADLFAFAAVDDLLMGYVPPRARAALFRATAQIRGTTVVRDVVDAAGHRGIAVRQSLEQTWIELVFDPETYGFLGTRTPFFSRIASTAIQRVAIVDEPGRLP